MCTAYTCAMADIVIRVPAEVRDRLAAVAEACAGLGVAGMELNR